MKLTPLCGVALLLLAFAAIGCRPVEPIAEDSPVVSVEEPTGAGEAPAPEGAVPSEPEPAESAPGVSAVSPAPAAGEGADTGVALGAGESAEPAPPPESAAAVPPPGGEGLSDACREMLSELRSLRKAIPLVFTDAGRPTSEIAKDVLRSMELGERFLKECGEGDDVPWVKASLGRDLLVRLDVFLSERRTHWSQVVSQQFADQQIAPAQKRRMIEEEVAAMLAEDMKLYRERIAKLGEEALAASADGSEARRMALELLADAAYRSGDPQRQMALAQRVLAEFPESPNASKYLIDIGQAYLHLGRYRECVDHMKRVAEQRSNDADYVLFNGVLFDGLYGIGDLEGMEALMRKIGEEYPERMKSIEGRVMRGQYEQWYDLREFWIGYARFALGDIAGAQKALDSCRTYLEEKKARLVREGSDLPKVQEIYLEFRVKDILTFLETYQGQLPRVDFDEGVRWATGNKLTLAEARGKVTGVVFRNPGNAVAASFLQEMDSLARENDSVAAITLGFFPSRIEEGQAQQRLEAMRKDLETLRVAAAGGFDASPGQSIFRSLHGTVGTASFILFDREGRFAWYVMDPRERDRRMLERVVLRLAK
ncbi:MAG: hypothetical protein JXA90_12240 [Planctomycetes bacterium]|nr:hypothetical protein [Planctomycetota bacterium]